MTDHIFDSISPGQCAHCDMPAEQHSTAAELGLRARNKQLVVEINARPAPDVRYRNVIQLVASDDVNRLLKKDEEYGASWKRRGGVGAYMMMVRKIDRIMAIIPEPDGHPKHGFDIFAMLADEDVGGSERLLDTMRDLRGYLTLIEAEHMVRIGARVEQPVTYDEVMITPPDLMCPDCGLMWFELGDTSDLLIYPSHNTPGGFNICALSNRRIERMCVKTDCGMTPNNPVVFIDAEVEKTRVSCAATLGELGDHVRETIPGAESRLVEREPHTRVPIAGVDGPSSATHRGVHTPIGHEIPVETATHGAEPTDDEDIPF